MQRLYFVSTILLSMYAISVRAAESGDMASPTEPDSTQSAEAPKCPKEGDPCKNKAPIDVKLNIHDYVTGHGFNCPTGGSDEMVALQNMFWDAKAKAFDTAIIAAPSCGTKCRTVGGVFWGGGSLQNFFPYPENCLSLHSVTQNVSECTYHFLYPKLDCLQPPP